MMIFTSNIENTYIFLGVFDGNSMVFHSRISASGEKGVDEYAILLDGIFRMYGVAPSSVEGAIIGSVVRPLNDSFGGAVEKLIGVKPLIVGPGVKTGLNIKTDIPSQIGADIVANAVAANALASSPLVVLDLGTATTLAAINSKGEFCGALICPGVHPSLNALSSQAAELPRVAIDSPRTLIGKNTIDSMVSGIIYGNASMIDGLLDRIAAEWDTDQLTVLATGAIADIIIPYCRWQPKIRMVPHLALQGLLKIWQLNSRHRQ